MQNRLRSRLLWWQDRSLLVKIGWSLAVGVVLALPFVGPSAYRAGKIWRAEHLLAEAEHLAPTAPVEAFRTLQAAVQLTPGHYPVARQYGLTLLAARHPEARTFWEYLLTLPEATPADRLPLMQLLLRTGALPAAQTHWEATDETTRQSLAGREIAVELLRANGETEAARAALQALVTEHPDDLRLQRTFLRLLGEQRGSAEAARNHLTALAERTTAGGLFARRQLAWEALGTPAEATRFAALAAHPEALPAERRLAEALDTADRASNATDAPSRLESALRAAFDLNVPDEARLLARLLQGGASDVVLREVFPPDSPSDDPVIAGAQLALLQRAGDFDALRAWVEAAPFELDPLTPRLLALDEALAGGETTRAQRLFDELLRHSPPVGETILWRYVQHPALRAQRATVLAQLERDPQLARRAQALRLLFAADAMDVETTARLLPRVGLDPLRHLPEAQAQVVYLHLVADADFPPRASLRAEAERLRRLAPDDRWIRFVAALAAWREEDLATAVALLATEEGTSDLRPRELLILARILESRTGEPAPPLRRTLAELPLLPLERALLGEDSF